MGMWCDKIDDEIVERKAWDLAVADGCDDPERMTYESDGGIPYPYGPVWAHYIADAIEALQSQSTRADR